MPVNIDIFAIFIFVGIVQSIFLCIFFFGEGNGKQFNIFHGLLLISIACCLVEIWLMYTGYIQYALWLVDFSEPFALLIGPFTYLVVRSMVQGRLSRRQWLAHLIFPAIYTILFLPFLFASDDWKYNAWMTAYHPELPMRPAGEYPSVQFFVTDQHTLIVVASFIVYSVLSAVLIRRVFRDKKESFRRPQTPVLRTIRQGMLQLVVMIAGLVAVKKLNRNDTGDHWFAALATLTIYTTSFSVIRNSSFFRQVPVANDVRYKNSGLTPGETNRIAEALRRVMEKDKVYTHTDVSLAKLGKLVNTPAYLLSQVINEKFGKGFFEWLAEYRIAEAKSVLKASPHLKIEEVAESVGYNSKSSFNTAFKKQMGMTPSEFRDGK